VKTFSILILQMAMVRFISDEASMRNVLCTSCLKGERVECGCVHVF